MPALRLLAPHIEDPVNTLAIITFDQPAEQMNMNDRKHRLTNAKLTKQWKDAAYYAACRTLPPGPTGRRLTEFPVEVHCIFPVHTAGRRDPHNWYPTVKAILDGLTLANVWPDDDETHVRTREPAFLRVGRGPREQIVTVHITSC
jgi:Holliday junction resolvase RusA-like endonuclease